MERWSGNPPELVLPRLRAVAAGDESKKLRYCYIENFDLTGVDLATLPHRMQFSQCIIGRVRIPKALVPRMGGKEWIAPAS